SSVRETATLNDGARMSCCVGTFGNLAECSTESERGLPLRRTLSQKFWGRRFDTTSTRLPHFITKDYFSMEKTQYRSTFVLWHLRLPEQYEPRRFWLDRT